MRGRPTLSIMQKYIRASSTHYLKPSYMYTYTLICILVMRVDDDELERSIRPTCVVCASTHNAQRHSLTDVHSDTNTHMQLVTLSPNHIRSSSTSHTHVHVYKHKGTHTNLQLNICTRTPRNRQRHTNVGTCRHRQTCREDI